MPALRHCFPPEETITFSVPQTRSSYHGISYKWDHSLCYFMSLEYYDVRPTCICSMRLSFFSPVLWNYKNICLMMPLSFFYQLIFGSDFDWHEKSCYKRSWPCVTVSLCTHSLGTCLGWNCRSQRRHLFNSSRHCQFPKCLYWYLCFYKYKSVLVDFLLAKGVVDLLYFSYSSK